jgi:acetyl esterase
VTVDRIEPDPWIDAAAERRRAVGPTRDVAEARRRNDVLRANLPAGPDMLDVHQEEASGVPVRVLVPYENLHGSVVFVHGGGWTVGGGADLWDPLASRLAAVSGCEVLTVDYRLSPEHAHPAALEDVTTVMQWAAQRSDLPLFILGESAGGNLAAAHSASALTSWNAGVQVAGQILVCPVLDADLDTPSYLQEDLGLLLDRSDMEFFWSLYAPDTEARTTPAVSPLRAEEHSGLPPTLLFSAGYDPLLSESLAYATALSDAGVDVEHRHFPDAAHGYLTLLDNPAAVHTIDATAQWILRHG